ncbi:monocarboxylate transporter 12 [Nomia melanderi]|uniref:monocarboxylate transporter 12 n=1 Tax=Nomia melanderi TaxID=2448451 RepID=UPI0013043D07|nr:monocarboxylate transporter 1-like [Nomia melanderi]XP_031846505.1 monocarboxylate transporter 1-like [Nomia melanderi]XP_031846506.1 monocarboxylate transporter 1-like [Nomia melanderi]XP_031846507.1 monocarboxylate transporter 1-like [Nomia melanderi]XP_031846508.1 monocarboxylate transporter 1-like [Nomia melanderi]XP_031846509.1 monocarboxylate transporter 1-like [Nomia melanderi]XP_031846510.1 monocarboxylate transporter 1-like [Nomia melanderi]XP_031846511.1 monocarboxylate transpor
MRGKSEKTKLVPPDGGWGWVVLTSALVVNFLIPGTVKSFGVLFVEFLHVFKASSTAASWMPALCYFLYNSLGPLSSILSTRYSYKTVTIIGGAFAACGMMSSYFANSVSYLYVSYGLMVGIGAGLTFPPTVYIVTAYFEKLRGFANGLCISGSAIGTIVLPPFLQYLLDCFGYRGAVLIMGAITLNTLVCGLLYHPVEEHMIAVPVDEGIDNDALSIDEPALDKKKETVSTVDNETLSGNDNRLTKEEQLQDESCQAICDPKEHQCSEYRSESLLPEKEQEMEKESTFDVSNESFNKEKEKEKENYENASVLRLGSDTLGTNGTDNKNCCSELNNYSLSRSKDEKILESLKRNPSELSEKSVSKTSLSKVEEPDKSHFFDLSVLKDPIYLVILISNSTSAISNTNFMILLPSYAISQGFDKNSSALLLSVVSALDLVGRISGASLSDIDFVPKYYYFVGGLGTSGLALALLPMATSYAMLSFFCALFGLSSGMYIGITTVILADMLGTEKLSSSYGISLFVNGVLQLVGPPACGAIFEAVGSYKPIFLAFGIILILGTALWAVVPLINRNNKKDIQSV